MDKTLHLKQKQAIFLSYKTEILEKILLLPIDQLEEFIEKKTNDNLFIQSNKIFKNFSPIENIPFKKSLYEHLIQQASILFSKKDFLIAKEIIGNLDKRGFFQETAQVLKKFNISKKTLFFVLEKIHLFDPIGTGAKDLQDSLLIQLKILNKKDSLLYKILKDHFQDFIYKTSSCIKKLNISKEGFQKMKKDFRKLNLTLPKQFLEDTNSSIQPDISLFFDKKWKIEIKESSLFSFKINYNYLKNYPNKKLADDAFFLKKALKIRSSHLKKIASFIIKTNEPYLLEKSPIIPWDIRKTSLLLNIPKSTLYKIISQKYIETSLGILPLSHFFSSSSSIQKKALQLLKKIIEKEKKPLSDSFLSKKLLSYGIQCSRRCVAKYRKKIHISNSFKRSHSK